MPQVKIISDGTPNNTNIFVDGVELKGVQSIAFDIDVDSRSSLTIKMIDVELTLEGDFHDRCAISDISASSSNNCKCDISTILSKGCQCGGN